MHGSAIDLEGKLFGYKIFLSSIETALKDVQTIYIKSFA